MRRIMIGTTFLLLAALSLSSMGCGAGKGAATAALATAQTAFDAVKDQSAKVLPEDTQKLSDAFAAAKADIDGGKIKEAMEAIKPLPDQVKQLADNAAKKKDELTATWNSMSTELPAAVAAVQKKVDELAKTKKLPAGLDAAKLTEITTSLGNVKQMWTDAQAAFTGGNLADALGKVGTIKQALVSAMTSLGLQVPAALQAS